MKGKKQAKICDATILPDGTVRLTFTRPHGVSKAGTVLGLHNGTHTVVSVQNKFILTARKWKWHTPYLLRARVIGRMLKGMWESAAATARAAAKEARSK